MYVCVRERERVTNTKKVLGGVWVSERYTKIQSLLLIYVVCQPYIMKLGISYKEREKNIVYMWVRERMYVYMWVKERECLCVEREKMKEKKRMRDTQCRETENERERK